MPRLKGVFFFAEGFGNLFGLSLCHLVSCRSMVMVCVLLWALLVTADCWGGPGCPSETFNGGSEKPGV